jgi:hypothetical protein
MSHGSRHLGFPQIIAAVRMVALGCARDRDATPAPVVEALAREIPAGPIVFVTVTDPIGSGFAARLAPPAATSLASRLTIPHSSRPPSCWV